MSGTTPPPATPQTPLPVPAEPMDKTVAPPAPPTPQPQLQPEKEDATNTGKKETEYQKGKEKFNRKFHSEYFDPCQEAADRSLRCLHRNPGDKEFCNDYFQAYRDCKKRWIEEQREEKRKATYWTWF
ncbi:hypothetical protein FN846DRAFT_816951 [Sphaerosporella brunnea]|uniref:Cysteine alpha-hairpin motif superfamily n=1 Tax=Sphaerosporella brunnea TaxID=1250544 RepID=A0A5J5ELZ6_9PEZI|nr:hypothetical protein FN846DRAFT_816951 [Sphaerosporella brunnea]